MFGTDWRNVNDCTDNIKLRNLLYVEQRRSDRSACEVFLTEANTGLQDTRVQLPIYAENKPFEIENK